MAISCQARVTDMLPAGYFLEDQQPDLVAAVQEMDRLRIMRRAHDVALEFVLDDQRITTLHACRHRLADEWVGLVAIEAAQFDMPTVQIESPEV